MQTTRPLSAEELVRNVQSKMVKAGLDCNMYQRQLKDIASLFEPERSRVELITEGSRAGAWEMFCYFKGIRHCFHSSREIAATFGIPIERKNEAAKRKREEEMAPPPVPAPRPVVEARVVEASDDLYAKLIKSEPPAQSKKKTGSNKKTGRMGSRFQNQKLVKAINAHVGLEVVCGNLRARLVNANLGGMTFELLDEHGRPCGDMVPPSQLAKRSCLAHQNNAWKSIKVDGITLDSWVCRLQEEIEAEDGGTEGALHAAMFMQRVDEMRPPSGKRARSADDDTATADEEDDYNSGAESDPDRSFDGGSPSKGLKLLSGAALQRAKLPSDNLHELPPPHVEEVARYGIPEPRPVDALYAVPQAAAATASVDAAVPVRLVVNVVNPDGSSTDSAMAIRLAQLEDLQARTMEALRNTTHTLQQLLGEAERLGVVLSH